MWTTLYLQSTDPEQKTKLAVMAGPMVLSILFHVVLYATFVNVVNFIFVGKPLSSVVNTRLMIALLAIMVVGFAGRVYHVQEIYRAYNYDLVKTRAHLDKLYITWIFLS